MFEELLTFLGNGAVHRSAMIFGICSNVIKTFEQEFANDTAGKNNAIDALSQLLQQTKTIAAIPAQATPATPQTNTASPS